ncbi:HPr kinase/phosphorylase [Brevundimonas sp.]|uniref:HPr kinase/phosphorylase n=1 Tax=Brevundimonas sp. TaxID=1871086 RepID=UPI0035AFF175
MAAVHATVAARSAPFGWGGVALIGKPGCGKSDLLLRLLDAGWRLVADDYAEIFLSAGRLYAQAPPAVAGRMEVRGLGIVPRSPLPLARLVLAVTCDQGSPERLPEPERLSLSGGSLPLIRLSPLEASAPARVAAAFDRFRSGMD